MVWVHNVMQDFYHEHYGPLVWAPVMDPWLLLAGMQLYVGLGLVYEIGLGAEFWVIPGNSHVGTRLRSPWF